MSIISRLFKRKESCKHDINYKTRKWRDDAGTPMMYFECFDCGFVDIGHVYADSENWEKMFKLVINGKEIKV